MSSSICNFSLRYCSPGKATSNTPSDSPRDSNICTVIISTALILHLHDASQNFWMNFGRALKFPTQVVETNVAAQDCPANLETSCLSGRFAVVRYDASFPGTRELSGCPGSQIYCNLFFVQNLTVNIDARIHQGNTSSNNSSSLILNIDDTFVK